MIGLLTHFVSSFQSLFLTFVFVYGELIKIDFINFYVFRRLSSSFAVFWVFARTGERLAKVHQFA